MDAEKLCYPKNESANALLKILEEPLIEVIELESNPPVQDSAKEIFSFFLVNNLTIF